jgi:hypothetical protein
MAEARGQDDTGSHQRSGQGAPAHLVEPTGARRGQLPGRAGCVVGHARSLSIVRLPRGPRGADILGP